MPTTTILSAVSFSALEEVLLKRLSHTHRLEIRMWNVLQLVHRQLYKPGSGSLWSWLLFPSFKNSNMGSDIPALLSFFEILWIFEVAIHSWFIATILICLWISEILKKCAKNFERDAFLCSYVFVKMPYFVQLWCSNDHLSKFTHTHQLKYKIHIFKFANYFTTSKSNLLGTTRHQQGWQQGCPGSEWHRRPEKSSENLPNRQCVSIN